VNIQFNKRQGQESLKDSEILTLKAITIDLKKLRFQIIAFHIVGDIAYLRSNNNELYKTPIF